MAHVIPYGGIDEGNSHTSCSVSIDGRNGRMGFAAILPLELKEKFI